MQWNRKYLPVCVMGVILLIVAASVSHAQSVNAIQFVSTVATIDLDTRQLTFTDAAYTVVVAEDCEIYYMELGEANQVQLSDIQVGDAVRVCGILREDGTVLAYKIRIRSCT